MHINSRLVRTKPGRDPGMAGQAALRGLISALNNQMGVQNLIGSVPEAQGYNMNLGYDRADDGSLVPRGQAVPYTPTAPRRPWTR